METWVTRSRKILEWLRRASTSLDSGSIRTISKNEGAGNGRKRQKVEIDIHEKPTTWGPQSTSTECCVKVIRFSYSNEDEEKERVDGAKRQARAKLQARTQGNNPLADR